MRLNIFEEVIRRDSEWYKIDYSNMTSYINVDKLKEIINDLKKQLI
jgi:hypothetical protein